MPFLPMEYLDKWSLNIILPTPFSAELDKLESDWNLTWFHYRGGGEEEEDGWAPNQTLSQGDLTIGLSLSDWEIEFST